MQKVFWTQGAKVSKKSFAPPKTAFAPVQNGVTPVQEALCSLGPKDLLHPPLGTFGNFPFSVSFPGPQLPRLKPQIFRENRAKILSGKFGRFKVLGLRVRPPVIEWKTGRNPKMGKNWPKNRKWLSARNGGKMAQKWRKNGIWGHFSFFRHFWAIFPHFGPRAIFYFLANFFPFLDFGPFSILYQAA